MRISWSTLRACSRACERETSGQRPRPTRTGFVDPRGRIVAEGSADEDDLVIADLDLDEIEKVRRTWQFFRDRRPETYDDLCDLLP